MADESNLVQEFFDFTDGERCNFTSHTAEYDAMVKIEAKESMICSSLLVVGASVDDYMLTAQHPAVKQKQMKFLLKRLFHNNCMLSLFNTNSSSKVTPFCSFTSSIHELATGEFSDTIIQLSPGTCDGGGADDMFRCKFLAELLLEALLCQDHTDNAFLTPALMENPAQFAFIVLLYWSLDRAHEVNALLVQYCVALLSQYCPVQSITADSDMDQEQARLLLFVQAAQNLQLLLTTGRLASSSAGGEAPSSASPGGAGCVECLSDSSFVRAVVARPCLLDANVVMLVGVTERVLLAFACLRYRYDVVKVMLELNLASPLQPEDDGTQGSGSPQPTRKRLSSSTYSAGMLALAKYWGLDTLVPQLTDLSLPPPPPAPPVERKTKSAGQLPGPDDEDEALLQQHIMNIQMHILQQEEKLQEDPGYAYFVDVCRDDALQFLASKPSGAFMLRPHDSGSNSSIYLSFRGQNAPGSGPSAGEMKTSHAIIRREKEVEGDAVDSKPGCGYVYRCGAVGPCRTIDELLQEISRLLPAPGLIFKTKPRPDPQCDPNPKETTTPAAAGAGLTRISSPVPVPDSLYEYATVDPNALLWCHIDVEEKSPKLSPTLWFAGTCLPPPELMEDADASGEASSNELPRKPLRTVAHVVQSVLHCLTLKALYRQLAAYLNVAFSPQSAAQSPWDWEAPSAKYICHVIMELMGEDFSYCYSDCVLEDSQEGDPVPLETRLRRLVQSPDESCDSMTEGMMRQHYIALFVPLLVYVNLTKRNVLLELTGQTAGMDGLFRDADGQSEDGCDEAAAAFAARLSGTLAVPPPPPPLSCSRRNFLTNHVLHKSNPNLDSWSAKLSCLTELEAAECLVALMFDHCPRKPVKIMHSTAPHRMHESSLLAPGVPLNDAYSWLYLHLTSHVQRPSPKDSVSTAIPNAIGLVVASHCEKFALRHHSKKPHSTAVLQVATGRRKRKSKSGSAPSSPRLSRPGAAGNDFPTEDGVMVEMCTPMMIVAWLESKCVINVVIKPGDTFTSAQKFIRYVDPWAVEPLYDHLQPGGQKTLGSPKAVISSSGKSTLGRCNYTPIVSAHGQLLPPSTANSSVVTNPKKSASSPVASSSVDPAVASHPSGGSRRLNVAEMVMSAFVHQLTDCIDIQVDDDPNSSTPGSDAGAADAFSYAGDFAEDVLQHFRLLSELDYDAPLAGSGPQSPGGGGGGLSGPLTMDTTGADDSRYTTDPRACYCYSFLSLWEGVNAEEWLLKCINNLTVYHSALMSNAVPPVGGGSGCMVAMGSSSALMENPLLQAPISPYHMSISNCLYRNSILHELWMSPRYVATVRVDLKSLKDISYRGKDVPSAGQWGSSGSAAQKDMEIYAVVRLVPASKAASKAHITGTGAASDLMNSAGAGAVSRPGSTSPVPDATRQSACVIDPKQMLDSYVTPTNKVTCSQNQSSSLVGQSSGALASTVTDGSSSSAEFFWGEQLGFRFPLPQQTYHINSLNPNHLTTPEGELHKDNYLNGLYEAPAILSIAIYQKSFSFTSALSGMGAANSHHDSKLGEVEIPLDSVSDGYSNPAVCDWYPLSQSSAVGGSAKASSKSAGSGGIWLLYLQLQLNYVLLSGAE